MAQTTGIDFLVKSGGTTVGGGRDATLTTATSPVDTSNKGGSGWSALLGGTREWSLAFDHIWLEGTDEISGQTLVASFASGDIAQIVSVSIALSATVIDATNVDSAGDREVLPGIRRATVEIVADYEAKPDTGMDNAIQRNLGDTANTPAALTIDLGSESPVFSANAIVTGVEIGLPVDDRARITMTFETDGAITINDASADSGIQALITAWAAGTSITALLTNATTSDYEYTGTAYVTDLTIAASEDGAAEFSGTLTGSGALTDQGAA